MNTKFENSVIQDKDSIDPSKLSNAQNESSKENNNNKEKDGTITIINIGINQSNQSIKVADSCDELNRNGKKEKKVTNNNYINNHNIENKKKIKEGKNTLPIPQKKKNKKQ